MGEIATVVVGGTPSTDVKAYWGGDIAWMASGDVHLKHITAVEGRITNLGLRSSNATLVEPPAVAVALAGQGKTRGTAAKVLTRLCTNQSVALIVGKPEELNPDYLFHNLGFRYEELRARSSGGGRGGLSKGILEETPIPAPGYEEQARIAEVLDTLDEAILGTERFIEKNQSIKQGLLQNLLTRGINANGELRDSNFCPNVFTASPIGTIPTTWQVRPVGSLLKIIEQGWSPDCGAEPAMQGEWGVLKTTAVVWEGYQDGENKALPSNLRPRHNLEVLPNDVLMTRGGPNSRVGVVVLVKHTQGRIMLSDKIYRLVPHQEVRNDYLALAISGIRTQMHLSRLKTGLAESQTNISQAIVKALLIPVPPKEEQEMIVLRYSGLLARIEKDLELLGKLNALKSGLSSDLLTGHIRTVLH